MLVHQLFEDQVARTPQATALVSEQGTLTYSELNARANQVARYLVGLGVVPGARIGLCCERTPEMIVGVYGILKAGAAYVPMDPAYPRERLEYMAQAANLSVVLTQASLAGRLVGQDKLRLVIVDDPTHEVASLSPDNLDVFVSGNDLIYIIFTSGTTGRPKGAAVYHRGFSNLLDWFVGEFQICSEDRVLLVSSPSFDLTQKNIFAPLVSGGALCLFAPGPYEVPRLTRSIQDCGITLMNCTPSAFYPLVEDCGDYAPLKSLRLVFLGGEPISLARLRGWLTDPSCRAEVANTYGPTECTDICVSYRMTSANMNEFGFVPLGRAIPNVQLAVVDESMEACGIGQAGELCVGGAGVGAGYINDPELTATRFISNSFSHIKSPLIYRTGDQVRWMSEGLLEFLGRKDYQVKVRGFRIELHEIESVLKEHPFVREAVVLVKDGETGHAQLRCYFTAKQDDVPSQQDLREFVGTRLPEHMVPSVFQYLPVLPLSPNGKVDRGALTALMREEALPVTKGSAENDLQCRILTIWTSVLGAATIGLDDNFFDIGGNSLALARVHSRLQEVVGREFAITELFAHTTVRGLAGHLNGAAQPADRANEVRSRAQRQRQALTAGRNFRK